ncbi:MAG: ShlB/FhaC/HecB family hemolysin secretion/activation protein [Planctomycetota bacterium]
MSYTVRMIYFCLAVLSLTVAVCVASDEAMAEKTVPIKTNIQSELEKKAEATEKAKAGLKPDSKQLNLPEDTSLRLSVRELRISGNTLISTDRLLKKMPMVYSAAGKRVEKAEPGDLYDFRILHDIVLHPGEPREVSRRTMDGFTQYILSVYKQRGYGGIYVYISAQAVQGDVRLRDGVLPVEVVEGRVSEISVTTYDPERNKTEKGYLRRSLVEAWSPVKVGQVINKKKLDDFVNLLNLNTDRYVSAIIARGSEPNSLALGYDVYEANPWHYYSQVDNSGGEERRWSPKIGLVNTNLTGRDDRISAVYQAPLESDFDDNYSVFGSYEFPLLTPRLRLGLYGGRNEFDISGGGDIDFLGKGTFYGGTLRLNAFQTKGWFFDITSSLNREKTKVSLSLFPTMGTDINMNLWGIGVNAHRSNNMSRTSLAFDRVQNIGGSGQEKFWNPVTFAGRQNTDRDFIIYTTSAAHSRYLGADKVHRLSGSLRWITSNERLTPSKMTTFGGLYSVRGYKENEIVADGGVLFSAQYEFDFVKHNQVRARRETESEDTSKKSWLRKLALLSFVDSARAKTKSPVAGEQGVQELFSVGIGLAAALGDNFDAGIYYGHPLRSTDDTRRGCGRWSFNFIMRW